jgi:quercetin dioxygenase-like cupin family protein
MNEHKPPELVRTWFDTGTMRVAEFRLDPGASGEAHFHSSVDELCVCLDGGLSVSRRGGPVQTLKPGERIEIPAGEIHRLSCARDCGCRYLVIQGVGAYDFVLV